MTWAEARRAVERPRWHLVFFHAAVALVQVALFAQHALERERMKEEIQLRASAVDRELLGELRAIRAWQVRDEGPECPIILPAPARPLRLRQP